MKVLLAIIALSLSCVSEPEKELNQEKLSTEEQNEAFAIDANNWQINKALRDKEEAQKNRIGIRTTKPVVSYDQKNIIKIRKMARAGDKDYQYSMAMCYKYGIGMKMNYDKSLYWFKKAADQGHMQAKHVYIHMLRIGP